MTIDRVAATCSALLVSGLLHGQAPPSLADHYGWSGLEIVKIDPNPGPVAIGDIDGDGANDIVVANNRKSRIEIHYQKPNASPDDPPPAPTGVNEIPPHWRYDRDEVSVSNEVNAIQLYDYDGDGRLDIVYGGSPPTITFLRQKEPRVFEQGRRHTVKGLAASRDGFVIADVIGDAKPELLALVGGKIRIWALNGDTLGESTELSAGSSMIAFFLEDFNGDDRLDIVGVLPDDPAPIRLWLAGNDVNGKAVGPQLRFEMPPLREAAAIRLPNEAAARLGVIEQASKRLVVYACNEEEVESSGDRDAAIVVYGFKDGSNAKRDVAVADIDGDGLLDLVATDTSSNALVLYRQAPGAGLQPGTSFPSYAEITRIAAGNVDSDPYAEVFVLSEKEGVVGRIDANADGLTYPTAIPIAPGHSPVAINLVSLDGTPHLAIIAKDGRSYALDLVNLNATDPASATTHIDLGSQSRSPETILALDADRDGRTDLLLFTPEKPMMMLLAGDEGYKLLESKDMGQFGLVQAADARNTDVMDIDGDGTNELVIADRNFVRAVRYDAAPSDGASPGWQVMTQINSPDSTSRLVSVTRIGDTIYAADRENASLVQFKRSDDAWKPSDKLAVRGFRFNNLKSGAFSGNREGLLAIGDDGFALINLRGKRVGLDEVAAWRTERQRRLQHEMGAGDVNSDGYTDLVLLDAGEQMCEILTFSETGRLLPATEFKVFESRLFSAGDVREFQPSQVFIADVTGDNAEDIILLCHDRLLIYPQMDRAEE